MNPLDILLWIAVVVAGSAAIVSATIAVLIIVGMVHGVMENRRKRRAITKAAERIIKQHG